MFDPAQGQTSPIFHVLSLLFVCKLKLDRLGIKVKYGSERTNSCIIAKFQAFMRVYVCHCFQQVWLSFQNCRRYVLDNMLPKSIYYIVIPSNQWKLILINQKSVDSHFFSVIVVSLYVLVRVCARACVCKFAIISMFEDACLCWM